MGLVDGFVVRNGTQKKFQNPVFYGIVQSNGNGNDRRVHGNPGFFETYRVCGMM